LTCARGEIPSSSHPGRDNRPFDFLVKIIEGQPRQAAFLRHAVPRIPRSYTFKTRQPAASRDEWGLRRDSTRDIESNLEAVFAMDLRSLSDPDLADAEPLSEDEADFATEPARLVKRYGLRPHTVEEQSSDEEYVSNLTYIFSIY
jgi:hypothetical protein